MAEGFNSLSYGAGLIKKTRENQNKYRAGLISIATKLVGITEEGDNSGLWVQLFQKAVDGVASKEPWCAGFVHYCLSQNDKELKIKHNVFKSESCLNIWRNTPSLFKSKDPMVGYIVVWQMSETATGRRIRQPPPRPALSRQIFRLHVYR